MLMMIFIGITISGQSPFESEHILWQDYTKQGHILKKYDDLCWTPQWILFKWKLTMLCKYTFCTIVAWTGSHIKMMALPIHCNETTGIHVLRDICLLWWAFGMKNGWCWLEVSGNAWWWWVFSGQWPIVGSGWWMVGNGWLVVDDGWWVVDGGFWLVGGQWSMVSGWWWVVGDQWWVEGGVMWVFR